VLDAAFMSVGVNDLGRRKLKKIFRSRGQRLLVQEQDRRRKAACVPAGLFLATMQLLPDYPEWLEPGALARLRAQTALVEPALEQPILREAGAAMIGESTSGPSWRRSPGSFTAVVSTVRRSTRAPSATWGCFGPPLSRG